MPVSTAHQRHEADIDSYRSISSSVGLTSIYRGPASLSVSMNAKEHARLKVHLKMSVTRLRNMQQKKTALAKANRRDLAALLAQGKDASARIRVENIIREDINVELLEILELYCELLLARIGLLESRECDPGLEEAVKSLIYAAHRSEVKELVTLRQLFAHKYGKAFEADAAGNVEDCVNDKVVIKLSVQPPSQELVTRYLREIARTYHVDWHSGESSEEDDDDDDDDVTGGTRDVLAVGAVDTTATTMTTTPGKTAAATAAALVNVALPSPTSENPRPRLRIPSTTTPPVLKPVDTDASTAAAGVVKKGTEDVDDQSFDALMARFDRLKRG